MEKMPLMGLVWRNMMGRAGQGLRGLAFRLASLGGERGFRVADYFIAVARVNNGVIKVISWKNTREAW